MTSTTLAISDSKTTLGGVGGDSAGAGVAGWDMTTPPNALYNAARTVTHTCTIAIDH